MNDVPKTEARSSKTEGAECEKAGSGFGLRFLTREELADVLQVSVRTVDAMVAVGEIPCVRLRVGRVRFYLPDVVRQLTATAVTRKRGRAAEAGNPKPEGRNPNENHGRTGILNR